MTNKIEIWRRNETLTMPQIHGGVNGLRLFFRLAVNVKTACYSISYAPPMIVSHFDDSALKKPRMQTRKNLPRKNHLSPFAWPDRRA
jgi:hypothetical protein